MKKETIQKGINYQDYRSMVAELMQENKTTGTKQTNELVEFTKLNEQRTNRNEKQFILSQELTDLFVNKSFNEFWIVFVEAWCGDCAQNVPIIAKIAAIAPEKIDIHFLIKSEHIEDFQQHLTNGSESIPKLIRFDKETLNELGSWGARPEKAQAIAEHWKQNKDSISKDDFEKELHLWYAKDRGQELQKEFVSLLKKH